jgi:hypothetical protein
MEAGVQKHEGVQQKTGGDECRVPAAVRTQWLEKGSHASLSAQQGFRVFPALEGEGRPLLGEPEALEEVSDVAAETISADRAPNDGGGEEPTPPGDGIRGAKGLLEGRVLLEAPDTLLESVIARRKGAVARGLRESLESFEGPGDTGHDGSGVREIDRDVACIRFVFQRSLLGWESSMRA